MICSVYDGAVMYVRTWNASIVKSTRNGTKVSQETVAYLGEVTFDQIPYLKAAYAKNKPLLVYPEESL